MPKYVDDIFLIIGSFEKYWKHGVEPYQKLGVQMFFRNIWVLVLWLKVTSIGWVKIFLNACGGLKYLYMLAVFLS